MSIIYDFKSHLVEMKFKEFHYILDVFEREITHFQSQDETYRLWMEDKISGDPRFVDVGLSILENQDILSRSLFISIQSLLEHFFIKICEAYENVTSQKLRRKDLRGDGIDQAILYIERAMEVDGLKDNSLWSEISNWRALRNCLVHRGGYVNDNDIKMADNIGVTIVDGELEIGLAECRNFSDTASKYVILIIEKLKDAGYSAIYDV